MVRRSNGYVLLVAVTMLVASLAVLGCKGEDTVSVPNNGGNAGSDAVAGTGGNAGTGGQGGIPTGGTGGTAGSGGDVGGTGGAAGGSGGVAGSGGSPTGGSGGQGGDVGGTGGQGGIPTGGTGGLGGDSGNGGAGGSPSGGSGGAPQGGAGGNPSGGSGGTVVTGGSGGVPNTGGAGGVTTTTTTTTTSDTGGAGGQGGSGGAGGGQQCPAWQAGPGISCSVGIQHNDPDLTAMNFVNGGQALTETDVFVVGGTYTAGKLVRYNGSDWVPQTIPNTANLMNVFALSPTEAYAVGKGPKYGYDCIMVELTSGNTWSTVAGTPALGSTGWCEDVWGSDSSDMFIIGAVNDSVGLRVYRGPKAGPWEPMSVPSFTNPVFLKKAWGSSSNDVYAVGYKHDNGNPIGGVLLHYDGNPSNEWVQIPMDPKIDWLTSVRGSGSCDVVVGGRAQDNGTAKGVTVYFDGNSWSAPVFHADVNIISGVSERSINELVVTGNTDAPEGKLGSDTGNRNLLWDSPLGGYGYLRGLSSVPNSDLVFIFSEAGGGGVLSAYCN